MKYPQLVSMPLAVQNWLEEQLEARGIDAAIYSRYILSLLRPDTFDHPDSFDLSTNTKNCGIESLVDELCAKLKEIQGEAEVQKDVNSSVKTASTEDLPAPSSNQDLALKYYAAFPALTAKSGSYDTEISSFNLPRTTVWCGKRVLGSSFGKNRTYSEGHNREKANTNFSWLEENKENQARKKDAFGKDKMRSRSSVKQQVCEKGRRNMAKSLDRKDDDSFRVAKVKPETGKSRRLYQRPGDTSNEPNYCKLVTCSTIKALWTPEKSSEDLSGCDQDLPMDFQQLLESPESTKIRFDFSKNISTKQPSFIQCGTNITSSIWSEKIEDNSMDCSGCEGIADLTTGMPLSVGGSIWKNSLFDKQDTTANNKNFMNSADECFKPSHQPWSDGENKFSNSPWKMMHNFHNFENIMQQFRNDSSFSKWSDIEGTSLKLNSNGKFYSSFYSAYGSSLSTLNHNKEDSSFTEVIPKNTGTSVNNNMAFEHVANQNTEDVKKEEEDLLTSMRTHFRPIRQEANEVSVPATTALSFPDGTTFPISNSLDKPSFQRSASGALYLDADYQQKYMEYHDSSTRNFGSKFVPKFRVEQNEKFCQTEDVSRIEEEEENDPPSDQNTDEFEEFYFPGDESLVKNVVDDDNDDEVDCGETEGNLEPPEWSASCIKVNGWVAAWPATGIWSVSAANPDQSWCNVWSGGVADIKCNTAGGDQYMKLRDEWTEEAEELLSDLSSIQNLYLANDYIDSNDSPKAHTAKAPLVEPAYVQWGGKLATTAFTRTLPFPTPYSVMQS